MMGAFVTVAIRDCISLPVKLLLRTTSGCAVEPRARRILTRLGAPERSQKNADRRKAATRGLGSICYNVTATSPSPRRRICPLVNLGKNKDWRDGRPPASCADVAAYHITAPQFWGAGSRLRTTQLRIVEMEYGLQWFFQWLRLDPAGPLGGSGRCHHRPAARFQYLPLYPEQPGRHRREALDHERLDQGRLHRAERRGRLRAGGAARRPARVLSLHVPDPQIRSRHGRA